MKQAVVTCPQRYDTPTIIFHWATAILVVCQWFGAQTIDWFPKGAPRVDARSVHITLGVTLAVLLLVRIVWRLTRGRHLPPADAPPLHLLAKAAQLGLYGLIAAMVLVGMSLVWVRGDSLFNLFTIPAYDPGNHALADQVQDIHAALGWVILGVAGLHAGAALVHRYIWHDDVLARMLPDRRPG
jgi:cytochrome b561